ncbi:hypothetical protein V8D89_013334 [Ganoderma adspersum]
MNISWSSRDHLNADVVDNASGRVLFHLNTPYRLFKKQVTTMIGAQGQIIGEYEHRLGHDRVTHKGETHRVSDWLPTKGFFSKLQHLDSRRLYAPNGKTYLWKEKSGVKFKLVDEHSDAIVAATHAPNLGIRSPKHNIVIDAGPEVVPFLDLIVLSFVICETERCAREQQDESAAETG